MLFLIWYSYNGKTKYYRDYFNSYTDAENHLKYFLIRKIRENPSIFKNFSLKCGILPTNKTFFTATKAWAYSYL